MTSHHPRYVKENYCIRCDKKYAKNVVWCTECGMKVRTVTHSGQSRRKYVDKKPRI